MSLPSERTVQGSHRARPHIRSCLQTLDPNADPSESESDLSAEVLVQVQARAREWVQEIACIVGRSHSPIP